MSENIITYIDDKFILAYEAAILVEGLNDKLCISLPRAGGRALCYVSGETSQSAGPLDYFWDRVKTYKTDPKLAFSEAMMTLLSPLPSRVRRDAERKLADDNNPISGRYICPLEVIEEAERIINEETTDAP